MKRRARWLSCHPLCVECEREFRVTAASEVDHIFPLADGGADDESNFQSLCDGCHKAKTAAENQARAPG
ncbi:HNH endonuclease [Aromatoleum toluolicum]|uniref:Putative HNH nuclease YajD n=1 Tax=Aromatoleum toluolicum TaxID=90060 RepID=A0ABX1NGG6_9RHOO|nr:HNH endonuclease [Aromatoleum toluolicum]